MRVNIYAEEMTDRIEVISKEIEGRTFTGLRFWLALPVTLSDGTQVQGPFVHGPGDDDSAAVTFWGKRDLRSAIRRALVALEAHYNTRLGEPTPGERGYNAYGDTADWKTFDGRRMPTWADLALTEAGRETQRRWEVAALAIRG